jgi:hypothetical protein
VGLLALSCLFVCLVLVCVAVLCGVVCLGCVFVFCSLFFKRLLVVNNALVMYFMKISSVLFSIFCAVSSSHFVLSCSVLCCSLCSVSLMLCLWWSVIMSNRAREASLRVVDRKAVVHDKVYVYVGVVNYVNPRIL